MRNRAGTRGPQLAAYLLIAMLVSITVQSRAQIGPGLLNPTPKPSPAPTPVPSDEPVRTPSPQPSTPFLGTPAPSTSPTPGASPSSESPGPSPAPGVPLSLAPGIPPGYQIPVIARTPARNTVKLVHMLEQVTEVGIPRDQALIEGMGRFPVAGLAWWSDDWMNPRFVPFFHLHEGVDIFAEFGTPIRSPDKGVVSRLVQGPIGGTAAWITAEDGTQYYFAHMQGYANGISEGSPVETGTVIGFVGDSGDAKGGLPHLHFEVHRGQALPPKPFVDAWLAQAEQDAPAWVASRMTETVARRQLLRSEHALAGLLALDGTKPSGTPEYSVLLTVLDPIGGSVGLLPDVPMAPQRRAAGSSRLIQELIRLRMDGGLLTSLVTGSLIHTDAG